MKILMLMDEMWNDDTHPNNIMTNWFSGFEDAEIAAVCCSTGVPKTNCCKTFFQITDSMMIKSLFSTHKAGIVINNSTTPVTNDFYGKKKKWYSNEFFRIIRSFIWRFGKYDLKGLSNFIYSFSPDIIFTMRRGSIKIARLEMVVKKISKAPMVAFTGDDEYSLHKKVFNPLEAFHLWWTRKWLRKLYKRYDLLYCSSYDQMAEMSNLLGVKTKFLVKVGEFNYLNVRTSYNDPIRLLYAGKLYCNRYRTLLILANSIDEINKEIGFNSFKLDIYSPDGDNKKYIRLFKKYNSCSLNKSVTPAKLIELNSTSDILLHVEGLDEKNSFITRYSFSTKLIDCLSSGSATMVVSQPFHSGFQYCEKHQIAFCASNEQEIKQLLRNIAKNKNLIGKMAQNATKFGISNHERSIVQKQIRNDFKSIIDNQN